MKIVSWNVNGIRAISAKGFAGNISELDPDVLCLQEIKADEDIVHEIADELPGYTAHVHPAEKKGYSGTAILVRETGVSVDRGPDTELLQGEGRIQRADLGDFYLVNTYVPNSGQGLKRLDYREEWDAAFLDYLNGLRAHKPLVLCGDLNVAHRPIDLKNDKANYNKTAGYTQREIDGMDRLQQSGLVDIYRKRHPDEVAYTYWSYRFSARKRNVGWRLDYFLISPELEDRVAEAPIYSTYEGSDHCPIGLVLVD
ncbi:exodeoxyribonuclease III [Robiginitalea sp. SC105]|uniref:exodeoxyribonuclease III n=1 Tax=Robiginitalea sp. SC105 TaxID=2762332 RepID=UPI00163A6431|nr:exodeoxyribonuclease III [Robiginitalea sp. SC105]MBC2840258.1 exodeoxyribonuclease III [Robiginitalea sp. SC105]